MMIKAGFRFALVVGFVAIIVGTFYRSGTATQLNWWGAESPVPWGVLAAFTMLCGLFFGALFRQLRTQNGPVNIFSQCRAVFSSSSFWTALCVSPLVFYSVFAATGDNPGNVSSYVLAFQNGFFCEAVFKQMFGDKAGG